MTNNIHPTAVIDKEATLGKNVKVGPFCVIAKNVVLEDNVELKSHVFISENVSIGEGTVVYPFASIGCDPQNLKYKEEKSLTIIGKNNIIREHVTIHTGTESGIMKTLIGDNCFIMVGSHIAHDCVVGNNVIMANNATLGGHVVIEDFVVLGGLTAIHQFVRIGECSMIGGMSGIKYDIPPFSMVVAPEPNINGINVVGLKRQGFLKKDITVLKQSYDMLFNKTCTLSEAINSIESEFASSEVVRRLVKFMRSKSIRGVRKPNHCYDKAKV
jgi:UDP-N-acetylglucosamine acyltransferase